jgi:hypothetical protein
MKKLKPLFYFGAAMLLLVLTGVLVLVLRPEGNRIVVINNTDNQIEDVAVASIKNSSNLGEIASGETAATYLKSAGESDLRLEFTLEGTAYYYENLEYIENSGYYVKLEIKSDGTVEVIDSSLFIFWPGIL